MKNTNIPQAILYKQGKDALKGDVSGHTDAEVRRKGAGRLLRWGGGLATGAVIAVLTISAGLKKQEGVDAAQAKANAAAVPGLVAPSHAGRSTGASAEGASAPEAGAAPAPVAGSDEAAAPAAPEPGPTEGAWTPTPGAQPVANQDPAATAAGAAAMEGGIAPGPQTGGVSPQ